MSVDGQKPVREYPSWFAVVRAFEDGRPKQAVEIDNVLADKVIQLSLAVGCEILVEAQVRSTVAEVFEAGQVTDGRIQPDVEVLILSTRNPEPEVRCVARYIPVLESGVKPFFELPSDANIGRTIGYPVSKYCFEFSEAKE